MSSAQEYFGIDVNGGGRTEVTAPWRGGRHSGPLPSHHQVHRGDTLWDITGYYYGNPWDWPRVWAINPDIANPHWIYPDDRVRLRDGEDGQAQAASTPRTTVSSRGAVRDQPIRVRNAGYLDADALENTGRIVGSPSERMMLTEGDEIWLRYEDEDSRPARGTQLTVYRRIPRSERDSDEEGELVRILGTAVVQSFDEDRGVVRAELTEALEPIERGFRVAQAPRVVDDVSPVSNAQDLDTRIAATLYPRDIVGDHQLIFIELGAEDGVAVGNRFFVVREADPFFDQLHSNARHAAATTGATGPESGIEFPPEIIAEARVVSVRPHSSTLTVTRAVQEFEVGDAIQMRRGF